MNISPTRVNVPGRIFRADEKGLIIIDVLTCGSVDVIPKSHILTLGIVDENYYEFYLFETQMMIRIDSLDAVVLEMTSVEIA